MKNQKKWLLSILYVLLLIGLNLYVLRFAFAFGESMLPTLRDHQFLIVWQLDYTPHTQDIVITDQNNAYHRNLVKRVIAVGGQTVRFTSNTVYVDDIMLEEPYLLEPPSYLPAQFTVPEDCVFLLGDNRNHSKDSRELGCIKIKNILGKIIFPLLK